MKPVLHEFDIIERFFTWPQHGECLQLNKCIQQSVGDDCALASIPTGKQLAFSMDTLVAGRHFPLSATPDQIATRAFCTCLSDLAAMGADPQWFTLALTLPEADETWLQSFSQALFEIAQTYHCDLVGGDTTQGPLCITLQVHGLVDPQQVLSRNKARTGDLVFVTGPLGDGRAALDIIQGNVNVSSDVHQALHEHFYSPQPQINAGLHLASIANAAIDISDGLVADLGHIAKASGVDIHIDCERIPRSDACICVAHDKSLEYALFGGDDYQLAFTVPPCNMARLQALINSNAIQAIEIGRVSEFVKTESKPKPQIYSYLNDQLLRPDSQKGYQHFAS